MATQSRGHGTPYPTPGNPDLRVASGQASAGVGGRGLPCRVAESALRSWGIGLEDRGRRADAGGGTACREKIMTTRSWAVGVLGLLVVCVGFTGCGGGASSAQAGTAAASSPEGTVAAMLELAEATAWDRYVDLYYGEKDKFMPGSDDRMALIARLAVQREEIVDVLKRAVWVTPEISGDRAVFDLGGGETFVLYRDGRGWKFHL